MSDDMSMVSPSSAGEHGVLRSMQEVAMSSQEASKMLRTYNIAWWGNNYYDVNELGHISVCLHCSASRRSCNIVCVPLTPRLNARVNLTAIKAITSWFTLSR